jgi:protein arginine kinase activator
MLCEFCHIREANIKLTQVINLQLKEFNICEECAEEKGLANPLVGLQKIFINLLQLGHPEPEPQTTSPDDLDLRCDHCKITWQKFQETGLLGCEHCYTAFNEKLKVLLRRIHGSNKHIGNRPPQFRQIDDTVDLTTLKNELKRMIKNEKYEQAAVLRDRIRDIETNFKDEKS